MSLDSNVDALATRVATEFNTLRDEMLVVVEDDTPPASPAVGDLWFDEDDGRMYYRFTNGGAPTWVGL